MFDNNVSSNSTKNKKILKATFSGLSRITVEDNSHCIFLISVGKENFEEEALEAQLKLISSKFKTCTILLADTLQKYNIAADNSINGKLYPLCQAELTSYALGEAWLAKYKDMATIQFSSFHILRWDIFKYDPILEIHKKFINKFIDLSTEYKNSLKLSVIEYRERHKKHIGDAKFSLIASTFDYFCEQYLIEECAVLSLLASKNIKFIVYPGKSTNVIDSTFKLIVKEQNGFDINWIPIRFKRVNIHHSNKSNIDSLIINDIDRGILNKLDKEILEAMNNLFSSVFSSLNDELNKIESIKQKKAIINNLHEKISRIMVEKEIIEE